MPATTTPASTAHRSGIPVLARGVHLLPFLTAQGDWQLVAVDGDGREVARRVIRGNDDPIAANEALWAALYRADPR